jgi:protein-L-isoaspartate(D-aspartate) O-methyltransferase
MRILRSPQACAAMLHTDRADYCPRDPYVDSPQSIGSNATISAPHMHAFALEAALPFVHPEQSQHVLDVGCGSGYLCVAFSKLIGPQSHVYGIEHIQNLVDLARRNTAKNHQELLDKNRIHFICEDGRKGFLPGAPYDIIHVGASSSKVPQDLTDQTRVGGVIIIPLGHTLGTQVMKIYKKCHDGSLLDVSHESCHVRYVPLTDAENQLSLHN